MKTIVSKTRKKSVIITAIMIFFAVFTTKAADQTVSINGLTTAEAVQNAIQNAINGTGGSGVVTVIGTVTVAAQSSASSPPSSLMTLNVPTEVTLKWQASLTGSRGTLSYFRNYLLNIGGGGTIEIVNGGNIEVKSDASFNYALTTSGNVIINGGTVKHGNYAAINTTGANSKVIINEGTVSGKNSNYGATIKGASSEIIVNGGTVSGNDAISAGTNSKVIVNGGTIIGGSGGLYSGIRASTVIVSGTSKVQGGTAIGGGNVEVKDNAEIIGRIGASGNVEVKDNAVVTGGIGVSGVDSKVIVSGGIVKRIVSGAGYAESTIEVTNENHNGTAVTVSGTGVVQLTGASSSASAIWSSGNVEVKDNAEVSATSGTAIKRYQNASISVTVSGGIVSATTKPAIDVSNVTVSGGTVSATSGTAINGGDITISGGMVSATSGRAVSGTNVTVSGGMVKATFGYAIYVSNSLTINGGVVFAYTPAIGVNNDDNFTGVSGTGVVIAWNQAAGNTSYPKGSNKDLSTLPVACAKWDNVSDTGGIAYENGTNKGFIELDGITVTDAESGITTPQSALLQIYPNPVTAELHIEITTQETADYTIFDSRGQLVMQGKLQGKSTINVQSLSNGIYYLKIIGKENATMKFIKT